MDYLEERLRNELGKLEKIEVKAVVVKKTRGDWKSRLESYGALICEINNPFTSKKFFDFIRCSKEVYDISNTNDLIQLTAYRGIKNKNYLSTQPYKSLEN